MYVKDKPAIGLRFVPTILTDAMGHAELTAWIYDVSNSKGYVDAPFSLTVMLSTIGFSVTIGHSLEHTAVNLSFGDVPVIKFGLAVTMTSNKSVALSF